MADLTNPPPSQPLVRAGDGNEFETCWGAIRGALADIHNRNAGKLSFEQLYRASYKIVLRKKGELLYSKVNEFEQQWFTDKIIPAIWENISQNFVNITLGYMSDTGANERRQMGEKFLRGMKESWENHIFSMNMIADVLMYLDRGYSQDNRRPPIFAATIGLFRDHVLRAPLAPTASDGTVFELLNAIILDQINMEREGDAIDKNLLHKCINMLESLHETDDEGESEKLYLSTFEPIFLAASREYYKGECSRLIREGDATIWLRHTQRRLVEESDRSRTTTSLLTEAKVAKVVEDELIQAHLLEFLALEGSGLKYMIDNDRLEDLCILYQLISRVDPKKEALKNILSARVVELGLEIEKVLKDTDFSVPVAADAATGTGEGDDARPQPLTAAAQQT
ncbi:MAG: cullin, partial [Thaumarchaeota archaeon]|nr:cullin [Nitrososphaerota archaeon]